MPMPWNVPCPSRVWTLWSTLSDMYYTNLPPVTHGVGSVTIAALFSKVWTSVHELHTPCWWSESERNLEATGNCLTLEYYCITKIITLTKALETVGNRVFGTSIRIFLPFFLQGESKFRAGTWSDKHNIYHSQDGFERYKSDFCYALRHSYIVTYIQCNRNTAIWHICVSNESLHPNLVLLCSLTMKTWG